MSNSNIYVKSFKVNEEHQAIANITTNEPVEDTVSINGVEYSVGGSGVSTLYCWRNTDFGIYYYTSTENPSVGDTVYSYLYIDGSGNPVTSMLKSDRTVLKVATDSIKVAYTEDKSTEATFSRYSNGDVEL